MNDKAMRDILFLVKTNNLLGNNGILTQEKYQALVDGYDLNYFANMQIKKIDSNKIQVVATDSSKPITLTAIGEKVLNDLKSPSKTIGFHK